MQLVYVMTDAPGYTDKLLEQFALSLMARGVRLAGIVQTNTECPGQHHCDMDVRVLPDGPVVRISQSLGTQARGCRLDPAALESAIVHIDAQLRTSPELLVVNKFGKHEADGRGLRQPIADALAQGIPVIAGVNQLNHAAFLDYAGDAARRLEANLPSLEAWFDHCTSEVAEVA